MQNQLEKLKTRLDLAKVKLLKRQTGKLSRRVSLANKVLRIQAEYEAELARELSKNQPIPAPWDKPGEREPKVT